MNRVIATSQSGLDQEPALKDNESQSSTMSNYLFAGVLIAAITFAFILSDSKSMIHWFILPAMACGIFTGADLIQWVRGEIDPFDPKGLVGLILFHGWFLAPLLHVYWDFYGYDLNLAADPRAWLGGACLVSFMGITSYKLGQRYAFQRTPAVATFRQLIPGQLMSVLVILGVVGVAAQAYFYYNYFAALRLGDSQLATEAIKGTGWLLMFGDSLPTLFALSIIATSPCPERRRAWIIVGLVLLLLAATQFIWSGLRGSRSAFVGAMFFSTCLIHFWWRRLKAVHLLLALGLLLPFMYYYGFYKGAGSLALKAFESEKERLRLERLTGRTFPSMLLGDLARADVQTRIVQELSTGENDYRYRWGRTYLNALSKLVPRAGWQVLLGDVSFKDRWHKGFAFYEIIHGRVKFPGSYPSSSRVYGLSGEAMLNFGFFGVPVVWFLYGLAMGWVRRKMYTLPHHDARFLLVPLAIGFITGTVYSDLDNLVFSAFKGGLVLVLLVYSSSHSVNPTPK